MFAVKQKGKIFRTGRKPSFPGF